MVSAMIVEDDDVVVPVSWLKGEKVSFEFAKKPFEGEITRKINFFCCKQEKNEQKKRKRK